jgi:hypothetical protein
MMGKLEQQIAEAFLEKLRESPDVAPTMIEQLRELFSSEEKLKADDLVKVFSRPASGDVK